MVSDKRVSDLLSQGKYSILKPREKPPGSAPGTLVHVGRKHKHKPRLQVLDYANQKLREHEAALHEAAHYRHEQTVTWVTVDGIHDPQVIQAVGEQYDLHPLLLEDILSTDQRPKVEEYKEHLFVVSKMISRNAQGLLETEQVSFVLGDGWVLCFQERPGDVFEPVRERIRQAKGRIRQRGADYLLYALLDAVVDHYFLVLERTGEIIEHLEEELLADPDDDTLQAIHTLKRELIYLQKYLWPQREAVSQIQRQENHLFHQDTMLFVRDLHDHIVQVIETVGVYRDMVSGMMDIYMSAVSNRMNEVMKVLTIIATIFIPLTFIAGVYGMNFQYMPELTMRYGYHATWAVMLVIGLGLVVFFRRKGWL